MGMRVSWAVPVIVSILFLGLIGYSQNAFAQSFDLDDLKAYYTFDETSGDLINEAANVGSIDSLGTAADGQLESGVTQGQSGIIGNSYNFPGGSNGQLQLGTSNSQFNFMHNSLTITWSVNFWQNTVNPSFLPQTIIQNNVGTTSNVGIYITYGGNLPHSALISRGVTFSSLIGPANSGSALPADGNWHMVTVTYDHTLPTDNIKFYHDGVFTSATIKDRRDGDSPSPNNAAVPMQLAGFGNLLPYSGNLDEMSIWNRALSPSEITDLYNNGAGLELDDSDGDGTIEHYLSYKVKEPKGDPKFEKFTVTLDDKYESATYTVEKPDRLFNPVDKNGEGLTDVISHYVGYKIKTPKGDDKFEKIEGVSITDQFGELTIDIKKPKLLLVPSLKDHDQVPVPLISFTVDHFKCYDAKETKDTPKFDKRTVDLLDQFAVEPFTMEVKKLKMLCVPVHKTHEGVTSEINGEENNLTCYDVKKLKDDDKFEKRNVFTNNQFGPEELKVEKQEELCVPSNILE